ncbi:plasmid mobilization protein [Aerococcus urinae]
MSEKKRKPGRPATGRVRDKALKIGLTAQEKQLIKDQAEKHGQSMTDYLMTLVHKDNEQS